MTSALLIQMYASLLGHSRSGLDGMLVAATSIGVPLLDSQYDCATWCSGRQQPPQTPD